MPALRKTRQSAACRAWRRPTSACRSNTNRGHAQRSCRSFAGRRDRLNQEREALPVPDHAEFEFKQETLAELRERIAEAQEDSARRTKQQEMPRSSAAPRA
jgi:single-stranded DNA-specific DHH superfamily exonuclease